MMHHYRLMTPGVAKTLLVIAICVLSACSSAPSQQTRPAPAASQTTDSQAGSEATKVNIEEIFPPGPGRALVINNCTTCHTFVPIVTLQMTRDLWGSSKRRHRGRVPAVSDADFNTLYEYLIANFNPNRPVPKLPQDLLDTWTP
jgi:hypothetical protein